MRISKAYWLWGLFPDKDKYLLNEIKNKVQIKLQSPSFTTHITLSGPYSDIKKSFLKKLKIFGENNSEIHLIPEGYDFKQEIYQSFFVAIKDTENLQLLRKNIYGLNKFEFKKNYFPHISLAYGNHEIRDKKELIAKLPKLNKQLSISKIALVKVDEDINHWEIIESFQLNPN